MSNDVARPRTEVATWTLLEHHAPSDLVAFGDLGERTARQLVADAERIAQALPPASADSHVELVFEQDRYALAATLIAALDLGHAVALPPNTRPESILALEARPEVVIIAHDLDSGRGLDVRSVLDRGDDADASAGDGADASAGERGALTRSFAPDRRIATVFTSGTTGPMSAWPKTAQQLIGEAHGLGLNFGIERGARIVPTVSPGHIYGLLFGVLLPLSRGGAFVRETPLHAESIARTLTDYAAGVLVSVPVQLRSLAGSTNVDLSGVARVMSSTGPLPDAVANAFHARHGLTITEVLGSTETGGFASRQRGEGPAGPFTPFPQATVTVDGDGRLCVDSPYVDAKQTDDAGPFVTGDLAEMQDDGRFVHQGRADGVVKIAGHRVALQQVEALLREQPDLEDAAAIAVPDDRGRGHRLLVAVAPAHADPARIRELLLERLAAAALPRRILACDAMPREENGKLQRRRLLQLFDLDAEGHPANYALGWEGPTRERDEKREVSRRRVHLPEDYAWFEGHFEGYPVLAGAVQLKTLLVPAIEEAFPDLGPLRRLTRLRWNERILPGDTVDLALERRIGEPVVRCTIERDGRVCTSGTLRFDEGDSREAPA